MTGNRERTRLRRRMYDMLFIPISYAVIALIITAICYFYFKEEDLNDPDSIYKRIQEDYNPGIYHNMMPAVVIGIFWMPILLSFIALGIIILLSDDGRPDPNSKWW